MTSKVHEPVRKELVIQASQKTAFKAFTEGMDSWWPRSHHIGKAEMSKAVLEPSQGGRWYEIGVDGSECNWGKVLEWKPYTKLILAWQITADWQFDPDFVTEVEMNFIEEGPKLTRFVFEHRNIERFGVKAVDVWTAFNSEGGWTGLLAAFAKAAESQVQ